ncbi:MAG: hypothetical protein ACE5DX_02250 [Candidatus Dojkabacteria bacterium]
MNRSWIALIVIAVVTMLGIIGYEFFQSLSGANVEFRRGIQTTELPADLGTKQLGFVGFLEESVLVKDAELEGETTEQLTLPEGTQEGANP